MGMLFMSASKSASQNQEEKVRRFDEMLAKVRRKDEIELCKRMAPKKDISSSMALIATPEKVRMVRNLREGKRRKG